MMTGPQELPRLQVSLPAPGQVTVSFGTFTNSTYQLIVTSNLESGWSAVGAQIPGDGTTNTITFNFAAMAEYFRCLVQY